MLYGWKENSMLTNCLAACAHLTITVSEIARDICEKIVILSYPLHSTPPLGGFPSEYRHPLWYGKLEWCRYPMVKKFRRHVYSFWRDPRTWQTDGHCMTAKTALASHRAVKTNRAAAWESKHKYSVVVSNVPTCDFAAISSTPHT